MLPCRLALGLGFWVLVNFLLYFQKQMVLRWRLEVGWGWGECWHSVPLAHINDTALLKKKGLANIFRTMQLKCACSLAHNCTHTSCDATNNFFWTCTHTLCYAANSFSCTGAHTSCYATNISSCTCIYTLYYATNIFLVPAHTRILLCCTL